MFRRQSGFTLIEMLIVIIVLGILAMIIVPQITVSTDDAKVSTLQSSLSGIRSAVEIYYVQHSNVYPGEVDHTDGSGAPANDTAAATAFVHQLTRYSDSDGETTSVKNSTFKFGPYIKSGSLPANPFDSATDSDVKASLAVTSITAARSPDGATAWWVFPKIGVVFANDNASSAGVAHSTY
jgi:prepilin-type N-terminal cleavage/methylation domain-containing protein